MTAAAGWPKVRLDSVGTIVTGSTPPTNDRSNYGREHLFVSPADLGRTKYVRATSKMLSSKGFARSRRVPSGSTLFVCIGSTIGKIGLAGDELTTNQQINSIVPGDEIDPDYLYYATSTLSATVREQASEQAVPLVNKSQFAEFEIPLPAFAEQRAIAEAIATSDDLVAVLEQLIAKKQAIKQGMMQELLTGRTRLPDFTDLWTKKRLGDFSTIRRGSSPRPIGDPRWFDSSSGVGWVRISDIGRSDGLVLKSTTQSLSAAGIARSRQVPVGTLIMSIAATVGRPVITGFPACIHDGFVSITGLKGVDPLFLLYLIRHREPEFQSAGQTGSQTNVNSEIVRRIEILAPPHEEQQAIAAVLSDTDLAIQRLHDRLLKAQSIKQGMMQELLTGRTRLHEGAGG